jgi:hypothetical protein
VSQEFQDRVLNKLDKIQEDVGDLKVENVKQTVGIERNAEDLKKHMKRSDELEEIVNLHKGNEKVHKAPLTVKNLFIKIVFVFGGVGTIAAATYGVLRLFNMLK